MTATVAHRVLEELRRSPTPLDDDQLATRLGISPRQTVNQACRALAQAGRLHRHPGPHGKIVNSLTAPDTNPPPPTTPPAETTLPDLPAGDSREQRQAERVMLDLLGTRIGLTLTPRRINLPDGSRIEIDGADHDNTVLVEAWAHHGPPKSAQKNKILADAFKLLLAATTFPTPPRLLLCLCDNDAAHHFTTARTWAAHALRTFDIETHTITLPAHHTNAIRAAQQRQYR